MTTPQGGCERCFKPAGDVAITIMSYFNTDMICQECCEKEKAHPKYAEAKTAEEAAVRAGNYNFPGIGKPDDL